MSYSINVSEQIKIHVVDKSTAFLAKSLGYYIDNFFTGYWIKDLRIREAVLTVDGETAVLRDVRNEGGKVTYRVTSGKHKGKIVTLTAKPSSYYAFRNLARQSLIYATDVSFTVSYEAQCDFGADIGIKNMIAALEAIDNPIVRKNVVYTGSQKTNPGECFETYRFDDVFCGRNPAAGIGITKNTYNVA